MYGFGALLAPVVVRIFLKPFISEYRSYYGEPDKEFLEKNSVHIAEMKTSTRKVSFKPYNLYKLLITTTKPATPAKLITQENSIIYFLRLDEHRSLYRLFERYFNYVFYLITALNATMVIIFSVLFLYESKLFTHRNEENDSDSSVETVFSVSKLETTSQQPIENGTEDITPFTILISNKPVKKMSKMKKNFLNILISSLLCSFYSVIYASFSLQSNYLLAYSIQPEYVPLCYDPSAYNRDDTHDICSFFTFTSSFKELFTFRTSYNFLSLNLITGSYLLIAFYAGIISGILLNLTILLAKIFKSIVLLYFNVLVYTFLQFMTVIMLTRTFSNEEISSTTQTIIWFLIQFFNGFFLGSVPALFCHYFTMNEENKVKEGPGKYFIKLKFLTFCEFFGLSVGAAAFQWLIPFLSRLNNNFNSLINFLAFNAFLSFLLLLLLHVAFLLMNKRKSFVSPN